MTAERFTYRESDYSIRVVQEPTTDGFIVFSAWYAELPGCSSQGNTAQEARENLRDAFELYMADLLESGLPVPPPASPESRIHEVVSYQVTTTTSQQGSAISYASPMTVQEERLFFPAGLR